MRMTRPVSDLRDDLPGVSKAVHETAAPLFLTKDGRDNMVLLSASAFEDLRFEYEVYLKLREAELEEKQTDVRYSLEEVREAVQRVIRCLRREASVGRRVLFFI